MGHMGNSGKIAIGAFLAALALLVLTGITLDETVFPWFLAACRGGLCRLRRRGVCPPAPPALAASGIGSSLFIAFCIAFLRHVGAGLQRRSGRVCRHRWTTGASGHLLLPGCRLRRGHAAGAVRLEPSGRAGAGVRVPPDCRRGGAQRRRKRRHRVRPARRPAAPGGAPCPEHAAPRPAAAAHRSRRPPRAQGTDARRSRPRLSRPGFPPRGRHPPGSSGRVLRRGRPLRPSPRRHAKPRPPLGADVAPPLSPRPRSRRDRPARRTFQGRSTAVATPPSSRSPPVTSAGVGTSPRTSHAASSRPRAPAG